MLVKQVTVRSVSTTHCNDVFAPPQRCTLAQGWAAAVAHGAPESAAAKIWWDASEGWSFSTQLRPHDPPAAFARAASDSC